VSNPDGYSNFQRENAHGVDINRNWGGIGCGENPWTEPEVVNMRDFLLSLPRLDAHIDYHGYTPMFLWPWGHTADPPPDYWTFWVIGMRARDVINQNGGGQYTVGQTSTTLYVVVGGSTNFTYGNLGAWAFTFEVRSDELPFTTQYAAPVGLMLGNLVSDCNGNGVPDARDIADGTSFDCNGDGIPDECELDCNGNGLADVCDIQSGYSQDCTGNGFPDECELDCNDNGVADSCDILDGVSQDCNNNGIPDECIWLENDCNENGVPDRCDIRGGVSEDCNGNGVPDECMWLEADCNGNGVPDRCDIDAGVSNDCQGDHIPDDCQIADGSSADCNLNGYPDECEIVGIAGINVLKWLQTLNARHTLIADLIPNRFDFLEGETGFEIVDGGQDMYDNGNRLCTNRADNLPYTNGAILPGDAYFGPGSIYFTAKYPGLFIMVALGTQIDYFVTRGNLGADGAGNVDSATYLLMHPQLGGFFTGYAKRVYNASNPSVNHLMIILGDGTGVGHIVGASTDDDRDRLGGLGGTPVLIYALFATENGAYVDNPTMQTIARTILTSMTLIEADCNDNGVPDDCDIDSGLARDFNRNYVIDDCECWCDLNVDGAVDLSDLATLLAHYNETDNPGFDKGDLDADGDVDLNDLSEFLANYGMICP
jgi:hypothetical protein